MTRLLFQIYWKQFKRNMAGLRTSQILPIVAIGLLVLLFAPVFIYGVSMLGGMLREESRADLFSIVTLVGVVMTVLFSIPQVFKHLFSSRDVEMLFTMPIATKHIFWVKYGQSFFSTAGFIWILFCLFFFLFGVGADANGWYYVAIPLVSLAIVLIGLTLAYLFNLLLIQILPRNRAKELMTIMTGMAGFFIILVFQLPNILGWNTVSEGVTSALPSLPVMLPTTWAGEALGQFSVGPSSTAFLWGLVTLIFSVALAWLTSTVVERGFRTGWIRLSEGGGRRKKRKKQMSHSGLLKHPVLFLGLKELRTIQRDPREWMVFLPMLFLLLLPIISLWGDEGVYEEIVANPLFTWLLAHAMIIFFFTMLIGNFTAGSIGREERAVWILRTLPLTGMQIALGKLWVHWLLPLGLVVVMEIALSILLGWAWYMGVAGVISFAVISLGMASIGLWAGTIGGKYNPNNPQQRIEFGTGFLLFFINIPYMLLMFSIAVLLFMPADLQPDVAGVAGSSLGIFSLLAGIVNGVLSGKMLLGDWSMPVGMLIMIFVSLTVTYLFLWLSAKRIDNGIQITIVDGTSSKGLK
jgi:ABC-2 type transport system permease protein